MSDLERLVAALNAMNCPFACLPIPEHVEQDPYVKTDPVVAELFGEAPKPEPRLVPFQRKVWPGDAGMPDVGYPEGLAFTFDEQGKFLGLENGYTA